MKSIKIINDNGEIVLHVKGYDKIEAIDELLTVANIVVNSLELDELEKILVKRVSAEYFLKLD